MNIYRSRRPTNYLLQLKFHGRIETTFYYQSKYLSWLINLKCIEAGTIIHLALQTLWSISDWSICKIFSSDWSIKYFKALAALSGNKISLLLQLYFLWIQIIQLSSLIILKVKHIIFKLLYYTFFGWNNFKMIFYSLSNC